MVIQRILMTLVLGGLWLAGCGRSAQRPEVPADAVDVRLEMVEARQYRQADLRFRVSAGRVRFDEDGDWLEALGDVRAELSPSLWQEETE